ncbi:MAG: Fe-only nitrogenase accessory AnfO family protein [Sporomusaceae bacterium]|nr:Fe-only nitrogenase accessory AnfO family protein [Sporomusaceae bacterium]
MNCSVAVHVGADGATVSLDQPGRLLMLQRQGDNWQLVGEQPFRLLGEQGLRQLRRQLQELVAVLAGCRVLAAASVTGIAYYELERAGFSVWEFDGRPENFLEQLLAAELAADQARPAAVPVALPVAEDLGNGCFRLSIKAIQESDSGLTSKQVLLPLLRKSDWYQFEIICSHAPPWLEAEALLQRLRYEISRNAQGGVILVLRKPLCGEV